MGNAGISEEIASTARAGSQTPAYRYGRSTRNGKGGSRDTLHCKSHARGSAAQFNGNVSAMPSYVLGNFARLPRQGTADTLLLR